MATTALDEAMVSARPRLLAIAYRMLGSMSDAEDVVQDAVVKARRAAPADVESPVAYLTAVTTRTAIDHLRSARVRRETYVGPWLPEPVPADPAPDAADRAVLADSLSMAFLVVLEKLGPDERAVLLLHDVFGYRHAEIAEVLGRTEAASRQLLRRARQHVEADRPRFPVDREQHRRLVERFREAVDRGDVDAFLAVLTDDATFVSDGGASVRAARRPILGADRIARFLAKALQLPRDGRPRSTRMVDANGEPALALLIEDRISSLVLLEGAGDGRIRTLRFVRNPEKLARMQAALDAGDRT